MFRRPDSRPRAPLTPPTLSTRASTAEGSPLVTQDVRYSIKEDDHPELAKWALSRASRGLNASQKALLFAFLANAFYFAVSVGTTIFNKVVLTSYHFTLVNVMLLLQNLLTLVVLVLLKQIGWLSFPPITLDRALELLPQSLYNFIRIVAGLWSLSYLNIPTNSAFLRAGSVVTLIGEYLFLRYVASGLIWVSVVVQAVGAAITTWADLYLTAMGVLYVSVSIVFCAAFLVQMKRDLQQLDRRREETSISFLLYQSLCFIPLLLAWGALCGEFTALRSSTLFHSPGFVASFSLSLVLGALLAYSTILANQFASPVTVTVTGNLKALTTDVLGIILFPDVDLSFGYLSGLAVSFSGAFLFSYAKIEENRRRDSCGSKRRADIEEGRGSAPATGNGMIDTNKDRERHGSYYSTGSMCPGSTTVGDESEESNSSDGLEGGCPVRP
ncbi:unnamed protein product [Vitrella brassicaformis CCMP3155]|uniref:Sugar phosphate transporter domain-containing protein n=1 Tax=Vitrella brassicaformis (strain CCMP3155) TaxID=1169540 RepID=A0A0G4F3M2_VITBC|nr:unnamed protein product [Vitrella brassicaformis CCMP3155]|eukprot:CEM06425.1 unnamed protein product [Vitrella brassicaformis CCMP3155]